MATLQERIDAIDAILDAGVETAVVDGMTVRYNLDALKDQRAALARQLASQSVSQYKRVVFKNG